MDMERRNNHHLCISFTGDAVTQTATQGQTERQLTFTSVPSMAKMIRAGKRNLWGWYLFVKKNRGVTEQSLKKCQEKEKYPS